MDLATGIASIKSAVDITKAIKDIDKSVDQATYKASLAELTEKLSEAKLALIDAKERIFDLERENSSLKNTATVREGLKEIDYGYLHQTNGDGLPIGFPMCPRCDALDGRLIKLVENEVGDAAKCPACRSEFKPVKCYLPTGGTLHQSQLNEAQRKRDEETRRMRNYVNGLGVL
jgi:hypothetical protein